MMATIFGLTPPRLPTRLVVVDAATNRLSRYEGRLRTHQFDPRGDFALQAWLDIIERVRVDPGQFMPVEGPDRA